MSNNYVEGTGSATLELRSPSHAPRGRGTHSELQVNDGRKNSSLSPTFFPTEVIDPLHLTCI